MSELKIHEACRRCRWWAQEGEGTYHGRKRDCYAHMQDAGGWQKTGPDERCPQFRRLPVKGALQTDVCSGCDAAYWAFRDIVSRVVNLYSLGEHVEAKHIQELHDAVIAHYDRVRDGVKGSDTDIEFVSEENTQ